MDSCKHGKENSDFAEGSKFLRKLQACQLLKKSSALSNVDGAELYTVGYVSSVLRRTQRQEDARASGGVAPHALHFEDRAGR